LSQNCTPAQKISASIRSDQSRTPIDEAAHYRVRWTAASATAKGIARIARIELAFFATKFGSASGARHSYGITYPVLE
jgi:S-adenosylmethionine synthetase